jgi:hypothetical protein
MSDSAPPDAIYDVYEIDEDGGGESIIGEADYSADGKLTLTGGDPSRAAYLEDVFARVNAKTVITELVAPPAQAEPTAVSSVSVARGDEGFFDALQSYLTKYYNLRLG